MADVPDALTTTVMGIIVAVPAAAFFNACQRRTRQAADDVGAMADAMIATGAMDDACTSSRVEDTAPPSCDPARPPIRVPQPAE